MSRLNLEFLGIPFRNPFLLASTPATRVKNWPRIARAGWAGGVTWAGECFTHGHMARFAAAGRVTRDGRDWALQTWSSREADAFGGDDKFNIDLMGERIRSAKRSGLPVGANILFESEPKPWRDAAKVAEAAGADFLELNLSCPLRSWGLSFCRNATVTGEIVRGVRDATRLPIVAKLNASLLAKELKEVAENVVGSGADAISTTNSFKALVGVDIDTGLLLSSDLDKDGRLRATEGLCSGLVLKPFVLRALAQLTSTVDVPIIAVGGVGDWHTAVEYMLAGATMVEVGTAAMLYGYGIVRDMITGLSAYMDKHGYQDVRGFVGQSRRKAEGWGDAYFSGLIDRDRHLVVDSDKCDGCGRCIEGCQATADGAMKLRRGKAQIDDKLCVRCNVCYLVCPQGAVSRSWVPEPVLAAVG